MGYGYGYGYGDRDMLCPIARSTLDGTPARNRFQHRAHGCNITCMGGSHLSRYVCSLRARVMPAMSWPALLMTVLPKLAVFSLGA